MSAHPVAGREARGLARFLPVLGWLPEYRREWLSGDAVAGLVIWALIIPEGLAYAAIAGVPVEYGLYSIPLACLGYAIFGTSRLLFVGIGAPMAAISAASVGVVVPGGASPARYVALTAILTMLAGAVYLLLGIARMGFVARFFAKPVLDGFIIGLGLFIIVGQIPKLVGIEKPAGDTVMILLRTLREIGSWQWWDVGVGALGLAALFGLSRFLPRIPGTIVVMVGSILAVRIFDLASHGVDVVGSLPQGFHFEPYAGVTWHDVYELLPGALTVVIVGFATSIAIAKSLAAEHGGSIDPNQELIGYGFANLGSGVLQGIPVEGSLSKSAAADESGARSPLAAVVVAVLATLTILFLTGLFKNLPEAILAAVVIHAVAGMVDVSKLTHLRRAHVGEFWVALAAMLGVVVIDILPGVVIGVALSFALLISRLDHPHIGVLGRNERGDVFRDVETHPSYRTVPGMLIIRFEAPLLFANAELFFGEALDRLRSADPRPQVLLLDFEGVAEIDTTGTDALERLAQRASALGVQVVLARPTTTVTGFLGRVGTLDALGEGTVFATLRDAVGSSPWGDVARVGGDETSSRR